MCVSKKKDVSTTRPTERATRAARLASGRRTSQMSASAALGAADTAVPGPQRSACCAGGAHAPESVWTLLCSARGGRCRPLGHCAPLQLAQATNFSRSQPSTTCCLDRSARSWTSLRRCTSANLPKPATTSPSPERSWLAVRALRDLRRHARPPAPAPRPRRLQVEPRSAPRAACARGALPSVLAARGERPALGRTRRG